MEIWAKSEPKISLAKHIADCLLILDHLQQCFPHVLNLIENKKFDFWNILRVAIIFHDLGKSHPEFQNVLNKQPDKWYRQRHELFSLTFIDGLNIEEDVKQYIRLIVAGHHKDFEKLYNDYIKSTYHTAQINNIEFDDEDKIHFHKEFQKINFLSIKVFLKTNFEIILNNFVVANPSKIILPYLSRAKTGKITITNTDYFLLLFLFGALKHCDHLGSAQLEKLERIETRDFNFLVRKRGALININNDFYKHQLECSNSLGNVILTSPTGSGKTESAMLWLQNQFKHSGQARAFYVLPFTASINAMFERLSHNEEGLGKERVGMLHGKLSDYLYDYLDDFQYEAKTKKEEIKAIKEKFKTITTPLKIITPFQLLKHLFGLKGFEQGIFELTGAYLIFDEIHAYSPEVFAQIKVLLEYVTRHLQAKVMIMTATMPTFLKEEIRCAIGNFTPIKSDQNLYDNFNRHKLIIHEGLLINNLNQVKKDLHAGKKVLVVCNTVKESQDVFENLKKEASKSVLLHSAFTGEDRTIHEKTLKLGERDIDSPIQLLVGTQAIEISLDIDYDIIYTDPAPIDALIQRFGRVNRNRKKGISSLVVYKESNKNDRYIYNPELVAKTLNVIDKILHVDKGLIKESKLQEYIDAVYPKWDDKSLEKFKNTYHLLKNSADNLIPMLHSKHTEEEFYKQFDGLRVLPVALKKRFLSYLDKFDFIGAERLKVQIRKNKFAQLRSENDQNLYEEKFFFETSKGKLISIPYWVITKKYEPHLGLLYDEQEVWHSEDSIIS